MSDDETVIVIVPRAFGSGKFGTPWDRSGGVPDTGGAGARLCRHASPTPAIPAGNRFEPPFARALSPAEDPVGQRDFVIPNCALNWFRFDGRGGDTEGWHLEAWDDHHHLARVLLESAE